ncbi:DUF938 domain-containing protein [Marinobacteraceae bacterium S3BR75-40.1]
MQKPFSQACENNKDPILAVLREVFDAPGTILEVGCGTGQHAVHFASGLPHLTWQPSDRAENLPGARLWIDEAGLDNLRSPLELDVHDDPWPVDQCDGVFSANTAHIMDWSAVEALFQGVGQLLASGSAFCLYGPFSYGGRHTSESNQRFHQFLKAQDPVMGIRDLADLRALGARHGLTLEADHLMPANNRTLVWRKS